MSGPYTSALQRTIVLSHLAYIDRLRSTGASQEIVRRIVAEDLSLHLTHDLVPLPWKPRRGARARRVLIRTFLPFLLRGRT